MKEAVLLHIPTRGVKWRKLGAVSTADSDAKTLMEAVAEVPFIPDMLDLTKDTSWCLKRDTAET